MTDAETVKAYDEQADTYVEFTRSEDVDPALAAFMLRLPKKSLILDLGCGPGAASDELRKNGFRVDPVDASAAMVELANETFDIGARQATFDDIEAQDRYDGIWANFSLLHAPKAMFPAYLKRLNVALKPGGVLHLGMKTGSGERRDRLGRYYAYYSGEELEQHLAECSFEVARITTGEAMGMAGDVEPWIALLAHRVRHQMHGDDGQATW